MKLRIATFNIENLFTRFDYSAFSSSRDAERSRRYLPPVVNFLADFDGGDLTNFDDFRSLVRTASVSQDDDKRQHTALAINESDAQILCLQEVDSVDALVRFQNFYLKKLGGKNYKQVILHEGNDYRGIDVAAMAIDDLPVMSRSHAAFTPADFGSRAERDALIAEYPRVKEVINARKRVFKRDCLELEVRKGDAVITVYVCHFKSMGGGRTKTMGTRQAEALAVRHLIHEKFDDPATANWLVVGDLNDYRHQVKVSKRRDDDDNQIEEARPLATDKPSGLDPLLDNDFSVNLAGRRDPLDQWTHYYASDRTKTQLDYILASPAIAEANLHTPDIIRYGTPYRVPNTADLYRYPRIGWDRPKASDHCPVAISLTVPDTQA